MLGNVRQEDINKIFNFKRPDSVVLSGRFYRSWQVEGIMRVLDFSDIQDGDVAECRIYGPDGFEMHPLVNPVLDRKLHPEL